MNVHSEVIAMRKIAVQEENCAQCSIRVKEVVEDGLETSEVLD